MLTTSIESLKNYQSFSYKIRPIFYSQNYGKISSRYSKSPFEKRSNFNSNDKIKQNYEKISLRYSKSPIEKRQNFISNSQTKLASHINILSYHKRNSITKSVYLIKSLFTRHQLGLILAAFSSIKLHRKPRRKMKSFQVRAGRLLRLFRKKKLRVFLR